MPRKSKSAQPEITRKKFRKPRKPMTPEQKAAAAERLALAREKRLKANPPEYKNIHPTVVALEDDHELSMKNVKEWIKTQKELISVERRNLKSNAKATPAKLARHEGYVRSMQSYLSTGIWTDLFYGEHQEKRMGAYCVQNAYYENGMPKRTVGLWYQDLGCEWTQEMDLVYRKELKEMDGKGKKQ